MRATLCFSLLLLALCAVPANADMTHRKLCPVCRRFADDSPSAVRLQLSINGHDKTLLFCSPFCLAEALEDHTDDTVKAIFIVSYKTHRDPSPELIPVGKAHILYGTTGKTNYSAEPYVAAFWSEKEAQEARSDLGGEEMNWDKVLEKCVKLAADWEPEEKPQPYEKKRLRPSG